MKIFLISKSSVDYSKTRSCDLIRSLHTYTPFPCPHFNRNQLLQQPTNLPNVQKNLQLSSKYLRLSNSSLIVEILCGQTKASGYVANFFHLQQSSSPPGISCLIWTLWIRFFHWKKQFLFSRLWNRINSFGKPTSSSSYLGLSDFVFKTRDKCV